MRPLSQLLRTEVGSLVREWEERLSSLRKARTLSEGRRRDHIPHLLHDIADALERGESIDDRGASRAHAVERLAEGFDLAEVVAEYAELRATLIRRIEAAPAVDAHEVAVVHRAIDDAIARAVTAYLGAAQKSIGALDEISKLALEAPDTGELLRAFIRVLMHTAPAVDTAAVLLREGDRLSVKAAVGLDDELIAGFSVAVGEGFAGTIAAQRAPMPLPGGSSDPLLLSPALRARGLRALYGIPLLYHGEVLGVVHMGSTTAPEFSEQDRVLLGSLAERVTIALVQAALRAELSDSESRFRKAFENAAVGIAHVGLDGSWLRVNQRFCSIVGYAPDELRGRTFQDITHPDDLAMDVALVDRLLRGEIPDYSVEKRYLRKDGSSVWVNLHVGLVQGGRGAPAYFVSTIEDISARRAAEESRDRLLARERTTRALLDTFLAAAPVGFALVDRDLRYVLVNETLARMNGLSRDEHIGRSIRELVPEVADAAEPLLRRVMESDTPALGIESSGSRHDGSGELGTWLGNYYPVHGPGGELIGVGAVIVDIADRKRVEAALQAAAEEKTRLLEAERSARVAAEREAQLRERILAIVSHDLRNPVQSVRMGAALLAAETQLPPTAGRRVDLIRRATDRMEHLIRDLLDVATIQAGRFRVSRAPVRVGDLIHEAVEMHELGAGEHGVSLVVEVAVPAERSVSADRERLLQALSNLIGNAIKFSPPGGTVELRAAEAGAELAISIRDEGPGIRSEDQARIFDPYWTSTDSTRRGTGLGLAIARGIIEAHGGSISLASELGRGTTFTVALPLAASPPQ